MDEQPQSESRIRQIEGGDAMTVKQIGRICRRRYTPIVFMAGETSCGKTTLIASLHDAFLFGPLGEFRFAGSQTLLAFEERCFESRAKSEGLELQTPRTRYSSGQQYFHFCVESERSKNRHDLLIADMSGEFYERSLHSKSEVNQFQDLKRAQVLLLLLDGAKLASPASRQTVRANALSFLRRCMEEKVLTKNTTLQVLISKWDEVRALPEPQQEETLNFVTSRINEEALGRQVSVTTIASRPGLGRLEDKLYGVRDLFPGWISELPHALRPNTSFCPLNSGAESSFARLPGIGVRR